MIDVIMYKCKRLNMLQGQVKFVNENSSKYEC